MATKRKVSSATNVGKTWAQLSAKEKFTLFFTGLEVARTRPGFLDAVSKRFWEHRDAHRKEIEAQEAEWRVAKKKADFQRKVRYGTFAANLVADYLMAFRKGEMNLPDCFFEGTPEGRLLAAVHWCVIQNRPNDLRSIAEAVGRVHARAEGEGKDFKVKPAKPIHAAVAAIPAGGTLSTKAREIIQSVAESGSGAMSERTARRLLEAFGIKPAPRGRPRKHPK